MEVFPKDLFNMVETWIISDGERKLVDSKLFLEKGGWIHGRDEGFGEVRSVSVQGCLVATDTLPLSSTEVRD